MKWSIKEVETDLDTRFVPYNWRSVSTLSGVCHLTRYKYVLREIFKYKKRKWRLLDFGCGSGYGTAMFAKYCQKAYGLDRSKIAIEYAAHKYGEDNLVFISGNALNRETLRKLGKQKFDLIVSFDVIEHIKDYKKYIKNAYYLLAKNGRLIIETPNRLIGEKYHQKMNEYHIKEFSPAELKHALKRKFRYVKLIGQNIRPGLKDIVLKRHAATSNINLFLKVVRKILETLHIPSPLRAYLSENDVVFNDKNINSCIGTMAIARK